MPPRATRSPFCKGLGSVSQSINLPGPGTYTVSFLAAQRGNLPSTQTFEVLVDNVVVGTFNSLTGTSYSSLVTPSFQITTGGSHTLEFLGTDIHGGDNTVFIDQVGINVV